MKERRRRRRSTTTTRARTRRAKNRAVSPILRSLALSLARWLARSFTHCSGMMVESETFCSQLPWPRTSRELPIRGRRGRSNARPEKPPTRWSDQKSFLTQHWLRQSMNGRRTIVTEMTNVSTSVKAGGSQGHFRQTDRQTDRRVVERRKKSVATDGDGTGVLPRGHDGGPSLLIAHVVQDTHKTNRSVGRSVQPPPEG